MPSNETIEPAMMTGMGMSILSQDHPLGLAPGHLVLVDIKAFIWITPSR